MEFPNDENGDVLRRMEANGMDFSKEHNFEFFAVLSTEEEANQIALLYLADHKDGDELTSIETKPHEIGGMTLILEKMMLPTYENITQFELKLADRVATVEGYLDGWGVLHGP